MDGWMDGRPADLYGCAVRCCAVCGIVLDRYLLDGRMKLVAVPASGGGEWPEGEIDSKGTKTEI